MREPYAARRAWGNLNPCCAGVRERVQQRDSDNLLSAPISVKLGIARDQLGHHHASLL